MSIILVITKKIVTYRRSTIWLDSSYIPTTSEPKNKKIFKIGGEIVLS
jgi:hypothetical protein